MSQRHQLQRILEIDRRIRSGQFPNADSLATELEVGRRVIFNDRRFMVDQLGAPIAFDKKRGGWRYTSETWALPSTLVTEGELLAFFISVEVAQRYLGTAFETPLHSAVEKIARSLQGRALLSLDALYRHYTFAPPAAAPTNEAALLAMHEAIEARRAVAMLYHTASRREKSERVVHPHHLLHQNGEWYLLAYDRTRAKILTFNIVRIEWWRVLEERFVRESNFDPQEYQRAAFGAESQAGVVPVVIRFAPEEAVYIRERRWHETQEIEELSDGGLTMRFQTSGLGAVKRWVLGYGPHAEVLEPAALRAEIVSEIQAINALYKGEKNG